jgi:hypothetical protein
MSDKILAELERTIQQEAIPKPKPLPIDRWLASSVLQKSIRRGDTMTAQRACMTLWQQDRRSLWSRLPIICLEDVSVASLNIVVQTLTAANETVWRRGLGDLRVALHLVKRLCEVDKIRLSDEVYSIAARSPEYKQLRSKLAKASNKQLANLALDRDKPLLERALGLWFLAGTVRYPSDGVPSRSGNLDAAIDVMRSLGAPNDLTEACIASLRKSPYPLALWTPLLWVELKRQPRIMLTWNEQTCPSLFVRGVPLNALDGFTRVGRTCFRQMQQQNPIFNGFSQEQIRLTVFYLQGRCLNKRLTSPALETYRRDGELADMQAAGLTSARYAELRGITTLHLGLLDDIRSAQFKHYLKQPQGKE